MGDCSECSICFLTYNENERRPLVLPCSHSFCQSCLKKLEATGNNSCSLCRKSWSHTAVKDLLCCYQLIPSGDLSQSKGYKRCPEHSAEMTMWCETCSSAICVKCLRLKHKECKWVLVEEHDENQYQATYNQAVSNLVDMVSKNSVILGALDSLMHTVLSCRDELVTWQNKAEQELGILSSSKTGQGKLQADELQKKCQTLLTMRQFASSNESAWLLYCISTAFQETSHGELETFMSKMRTIPDPFLRSKGNAKPAAFKPSGPQTPSAPPATNSDVRASEASNPHLILRRSMMEVLQQNTRAVPSFQNHPSFQDGKLWIIEDNASLSAAHGALRSTLVTPSHVSIKSFDLDEREMSDFIALLSKTRCRVSIKVLNTFWTPSPRIVQSGSHGRGIPIPSITILTTRSILFSLMKPEVRCVLTEFWGHLDEDCIKKLRPTLRTVGIALTDKEDMATVNMLVEADAGKWVSKRGWSVLHEINLSVAKSFLPSNWTLQKKSRGLFSSSVSISSSPPEGLVVRLHFPRVQVVLSDVRWLKEILRKIAEQINYEGILRDVYLPDTQITPASLENVVREFGLTAFTVISSVTVHFASSCAHHSYSGPRRIGKCHFQWDIDS